jgi:peptidoglycan hydrolase-like protein with peptidoglycan-binding domain
MTIRTLTTGALLFALVGAGCSSGDSQATAKAMEQRMREIEKKMKDSMPKTQQIAITQKVDAALITRAQEALTTLKEYMDKPSGKIDMVTVNAIQAFQRREGVPEDGLLTEELLKKIEEAAAKAKS